jgi:hypothetical protein
LKEKWLATPNIPALSLTGRIAIVVKKKTLAFKARVFFSII